jgi:hypothetical protein
MTAMNIVKRHDEIIIISDGAGYGQDGTLLFAAPKVDMLAHFSGFVMQSGGSAWTAPIVAMFSHFATDTDDLFSKASWILTKVEQKYAGISAEPMGRVIFGGFSEEKKQMRLGAVFSEAAATLDQDGKGGDVVRPDAYDLHELEGDQLLTQPPIGERLWIEAMGGPVYDVGEIKNIEEFASNLLAAQRTIGAPFRGVGAFGQITRVTKTECATRIFERYDDEVGEVMLPLVFDWQARRARRVPAIPEGLSRLQRERMEKKARKGTLRAV